MEITAVIHMLLSVAPILVVGSATMVWLFMLLFKRRKLYGWIDRRAGAIITPDRLFSKLQLQGIIPVLLLCIALYVPAIYAFCQHKTDVASVLLQLLCFGLCGAYCHWLVVRNSRTMPRRKARMMLLYAFMSVCTVVAGVILAVYVIYLVVILAIGYAAMSVLGEAGSGGGGKSSSEESSDNDAWKICGHCHYFTGDRCSKYYYSVTFNDPGCSGFWSS